MPNNYESFDAARDHANGPRYHMKGDMEDRSSQQRHGRVLALLRRLDALFWQHRNVGDTALPGVWIRGGNNRDSLLGHREGESDVIDRDDGAIVRFPSRRQRMTGSICV